MNDNNFAPTFYSSLLYQARLHPHAFAVSHGEHNVTYARFVADTERVTRRLNSLALPQTGVVLVTVFRPYLHWLCLIALGRIGLVSASAFATSRQQALDVLKPAVVLADADIDTTEQRVIRIDEQWLAHDDSLPPFIDTMNKPDHPARITLSSGTTGTPKKVLLSHGELQIRLKNQIAAFDLSSSSCTMTSIGLETGIGSQLPLSTWTVGGKVVLHIRGEKRSWLILRAEVNLLFISPAQLAPIVDSLPGDFRPIPSLTVIVGGSALSKTLSYKTRFRLSPSLYISYGSTEAGGGTHAHAGVLDANPGATGYVLPWVDLQVVDADDRPVANGTVGEVRIRSAGCVTQYLGEPEASDRAQQAFRDGWFYPGDAGVLTDTGLLSIIGRTRELINVGGVKVAPGVIEEALSSCPGVTDIAAFSVDQANGMQRPWVAVVQGAGYDLEAIIAAFKQRFPNLPGIEVATIDRIPRNDAGKVMRNDLRTMVKGAARKTN